MRVRVRARRLGLGGADAVVAQLDPSVAAAVVGELDQLALLLVHEEERRAVAPRQQPALAEDDPRQLAHLVRVRVRVKVGLVEGVHQWRLAAPG